jgi:hypothetical protein
MMIFKLQRNFHENIGKTGENPFPAMELLRLACYTKADGNRAVAYTESIDAYEAAFLRKSLEEEL